MVTKAEEKWAREWVESVASILAMGPPTESPEEYERQVEQIKKIALEPGSKIYEMAQRWRKKLIEAISV